MSPPLPLGQVLNGTGGGESTDADKPNTDKDAAGGSRFDYTLGLGTLVHDFVHRRRAYRGFSGSCVRTFATSYVE